MPTPHPTDLRERVFEFVCRVVLFCRELSKEPGTVRHLYWLRLILNCRLADPDAVQPLLAEANELTAMLTAGMKRLHPA